MTIRIEIKSTDLTPRQVTSKGGKIFNFLEQTGWAHTYGPNGEPNPYPEKLRVTLPRGQSDAYPPGEYTLHPASFYVGQWGDLELSTRLAPVKARG